MPDAPSPHDLQRQIDRLAADCERRAGDHVHRDLWISERDSLRRDIKKLEKTIESQQDSTRWAWRTAVGAVVVTLVPALMRALGAGGL